MKRIVLCLLLTTLAWQCRENPDAPPDAKEYYTCSMHPQVRKQKPGVCPICGMRLTLVQAMNDPAHKDHPEAKAGPGEIPVTSIRIPAESLRALGAPVIRIGRNSRSRVINSPGNIAYDPDLYQAIVEYRAAVSSASLMNDMPGGTVHNHDIFSGTRDRLKQLGLSNSEIRRIYSIDPRSFILGSGRKVYVYSQIYEQDIAHVKAGQKVEVEVYSFPGRVFKGSIAGVGNILDEKTRSLKIRSLVDDPKQELKPQMFADVKILVPLPRGIYVPRSAVLHSGERDVVFLQTEKDVFSQRTVVLGEETGEEVAIVSGLKDGDEIVAGAAFLIDSEARLKFGRSLSEPADQPKKK